MDWTSLARQILRWRTNVRDALQAPPPSPSNNPEHYAGLAVSPVAFSHQMSEMQLSLQRVNQEYAEETARAGAPDRHS